MPAARQSTLLYTLLVVSAIVLIGPSDSLATLGERLDVGAALQTFADSDSHLAIEHILRHKPRLVVVESEFSATGPGAALIGRIKGEPALVNCEVRIVVRDGASPRGTSKRKSGTGIKVAAGVALYDEKMTRRVPRTRMKDGLPVTVDGNPAVLVDLSAVGAQLLSPVVLRPNQRVRIALSEGKGGLRCAGAIAWASFEMPVGLPPRYRAGVRFTTGDAEALSGFAERHKANGSGDPGRD